MGNYCVTGSASGIGQATARQLEAAGNRVIGVDLHGAEITADFSTAEGRTAAIEGVLAASGGVLDGLVPCAGVSGGDPAKVVSINYFGVVALVEGLHDALAAGTDPAVVLISSNSTTTTPGVTYETAGMFLQGEAAAIEFFAPLYPHMAYASGKVAIAHWVRAQSVLPRWAGAGIRMNAVAPGVIETNMTKPLLDDPDMSKVLASIPIAQNRYGKPEEIAEAICFLLSTKASYIVGQTLFVDGGTDAIVQPTAHPHPLG